MTACGVRPVHRAARLLQVWQALLLALAFAGPAHADVFNPAYLQLTEGAEGQWQVVWRIPARGPGGPPPEVILPPQWLVLAPQERRSLDGYLVSAWRVAVPPGAFDGAVLQFASLRGGITDIILRVEHANGAETVERLGVDAERYTLRGPANALTVAGTYFVLGVEHILFGPDHLLFVLALLLIVAGWRQLLLTVTAFTVAHSITLVAASLQWVRVPIAPVEAIIALSIVFVAAEALHGMRGKPGLTARLPWVVAFTFGLLHGLGFASALSEIGLPQHALVPALLMFNVGVEAGQVLFVAAVLAVGALLRRVVSGGTEMLRGSTAYVIGTVAAFWTVERIYSGVLGFPA
jgi:hydrogenase/urease accessory protein HupE